MSFLQMAGEFLGIQSPPLFTPSAVLSSHFHGNWQLATVMALGMCHIAHRWDYIEARGCLTVT